MKIDLLFDPFGGSWPDLRAGAIAAEDAGFDGLWTWDHLAGSVHRAPYVLECWTVLTAMAAVTESISVGSLVLNVANRRADVTAQIGPRMARLAGAVADGINVPAMSADLQSLVEMARSAHAEGGKDPDAFLVTAFAGMADPWLDDTSRARAKLAKSGVDRLMLITNPLYSVPDLATPR